jgi:hypothetical protein
MLCSTLEAADKGIHKQPIFQSGNDALQTGNSQPNKWCVHGVPNLLTHLMQRLRLLQEIFRGSLLLLPPADQLVQQAS